MTSYNASLLVVVFFFTFATTSICLICFLERLAYYRELNKKVLYLFIPVAFWIS